jgi:hypothetical protein
VTLVAAAPVWNRAWAIPTWFRCLADQTRPPDQVLLVWSSVDPNGVHDATREAIFEASRETGLRAHVLAENGLPKHQRHDSSRFYTLAKLRNTMLAYAYRAMGAWAVLSVDTDVFLEDRETVERLAIPVWRRDWDTASAITWLHPHGAGSWAWNAGWWAGGIEGDPRRPWYRGDTEAVRAAIDDGDDLPIDIPMAVTMLGPRVLAAARYRWHESGEDIGFAHALDEVGANRLWRTSLRARHAWDESQLYVS